MKVLIHLLHQVQLRSVIDRGNNISLQN